MASSQEELVQHYKQEGGPPAPINRIQSERSIAIEKINETLEGTRASTTKIEWNNDMEQFVVDDHSQRLCHTCSVDESQLHEQTPKHKNETIKKAQSSKQDPPGRDPPEDYKSWPQRDALSFTRFMTFYGEGSFTAEHELAATMIQEARQLRKDYFGGRLTTCKFSSGDKLHFAFKEGIMNIYNQEHKQLVNVPSLDKFTKDYYRLVELCLHGALRTFSFQRLQMLSQSFKMHVTLNSVTENNAKSSLLGMDFYRTMKVDNHIHLAAAFSAKRFVQFVSEKIQTEPDTVVTEDGQTLREVFDDAGIASNHFTIDAFSVLADHSTYQRFDNFNSKYSPFKMAKLRRIFLKVKNEIKGRYFAELTKMQLQQHELSLGHNNSAVEFRVSIYGMESDEWEILAEWVLTDWNNKGRLLSSHNRWIIQIPRLWRIYAKKSSDNTFADMLVNIFQPMFLATLYPERYPRIAEFLTHIVGLDSVDDEGEHEEPLSSTFKPNQWTADKKNPSYSYQLYYIFANLQILNQLRKHLQLNTIAFRPHAGETGDEMHLATTYMLCQSINHGVNLHNQVSLQYLYYLDQIGCSISPLSNHFLFRKLQSNPFSKLFVRGLNVTLSTDDPLLFHMSDDALLEEYSVARASFDLSMTDISEIARNSVLQSGFEHSWKQRWLGTDYLKGVTHCDETKTHVPLIRAKYRAEHLALENMLVVLLSEKKGKDVLKEMMVQFGLARDAHRHILMRNFLEVPQSL